MWENGKKTLSAERKEELCSFFGLENPDFFDDLTPEMYDTIQNIPVYKLPNESDSERFSFRCFNDYPDRTYQTKLRTPVTEDALSLDEKCALKRNELKNLFAEFNEHTIEDVKKNTFNNLLGINRVLRVLTPTLELLKESRKKYPEYVVIYLYTFFSVLDSLSISYGVLDKEDLLNQKSNYQNPELYDYRNFSVEVSEIITKHYDEICIKIPSKRDNPNEKFRSRKAKE